MEIEFQGRYEKQTFFKAVWMLISPSKLNLIIRIVLTILVMAIYIALFILIGNKEEISKLDWARLVRHFVTLPIILYFLLIPFIKPISIANKLWKDPLLQGLMTGELNANGVEITYNKRGYSQKDWAKYQRKIICNEFIVLLTNDGILSLIPKNFFKSDQEWNNAKKLVDWKVQNAI